MELHYNLNVILVCVRFFFFINILLIFLGFMLIGNRGSTCFSGIWRPDQLPICIEGILFFLYIICLEFMSIIQIDMCPCNIHYTNLLVKDNHVNSSFLFFFFVFIKLSLKTYVEQLTLTCMSSSRCMCMCMCLLCLHT